MAVTIYHQSCLYHISICSLLNNVFLLGTHTKSNLQVQSDRHQLLFPLLQLTLLKADCTLSAQAPKGGQLGEVFKNTYGLTLSSAALLFCLADIPKTATDNQPASMPALK